MSRKPKLASVADRVRGCIAIALTVTSISIATNTNDTRTQGICIIAFILYFCTSLAIVFENADNNWT